MENVWFLGDPEDAFIAGKGELIIYILTIAVHLLKINALYD